MKLFDLLGNRSISFSKPSLTCTIQKYCHSLVHVCVGGGVEGVGREKVEGDGGPENLCV